MVRALAILKKLIQAKTQIEVYKTMTDIGECNISIADAPQAFEIFNLACMEDKKELIFVIEQCFDQIKSACERKQELFESKQVRTLEIEALEAKERDQMAFIQQGNTTQQAKLTRIYTKKATEEKQLAEKTRKFNKEQSGKEFEIETANEAYRGYDCQLKSLRDAIGVLKSDLETTLDEVSNARLESDFESKLEEDIKENIRIVELKVSQVGFSVFKSVGFQISIILEPRGRNIDKGKSK